MQQVKIGTISHMGPAAILHFRFRLILLKVKVFVRVSIGLRLQPRRPDREPVNDPEKLESASLLLPLLL
jgi:hypothetical protein